MTDHWAKLDTILTATIEPTGPEWFTLKQFCERYGLSDKTARARLVALIKDGKAEGWEKGGRTVKYRAV